MTQKDTVIELLRKAIEQEDWKLVTEALEILLIEEDKFDFFDENIDN